VLKTPEGEVIFAEGQYVGETTNNVAEYKALLLGLERALEHGVRHIEVRADSELLIKQLRGEYKVRSTGLKPLHQRALDLLKEFDSPKLVHVRRELNAEADRLANRGINEAKRAAKAGEPGPDGT
jgi:ribonuclease HI